MSNNDTSDSWNDRGIEGKGLLKDELWGGLCGIQKHIDGAGRQDHECGREEEEETGRGCSPRQHNSGNSRDAWRTGEAVDRVGENGWNTG